MNTSKISLRTIMAISAPLSNSLSAYIPLAVHGLEHLFLFLYNLGKVKFVRQVSLLLILTRTEKAHSLGFSPAKFYPLCTYTISVNSCYGILAEPVYKVYAFFLLILIF